VADTRKTVSPTVSRDAILKQQMPSIQADLDAIAVERDHAMSRNEQFNGGIVGLRELGYGLVSCHWSTPPMVVRACRLLITVGRPVLLFIIYQ
jgi:hypothetical protein